MVKRVVVGAHYGLRDWLVQRISAVVMAVYSVFLAAAVVARLPLTYEAWRMLFAHEWMRLFTMLFLLSMFLHAWVGIRDILMDYIQPMALRLALETIAALALVTYGLWAASILWGA
jgi:succinate dehydrogenase / fumarate reductase, membrane anchor subunit